jgi:predicted NAD-dependent protein-ADP-ribosyltransferase YbiA (DUF1768 family)
MEESYNKNHIRLWGVIIYEIYKAIQERCNVFRLNDGYFGEYWEHAEREAPRMETELTKSGFWVIYPSDEEIKICLSDSKDVYVEVIINWERINLEYLKEMLFPIEKWKSEDCRVKKSEVIYIWTYARMTVENIIDIDSRGCYPSCALSNLCPSVFEFEGVGMQSMEGFLQSLKTSDATLQKQIRSLSHREAKNAGEALKEQFDGKHVHWQGQTIDRFSEEYQQLLKRAFRAKWEQDADFRDALSATKGKTLIHGIGKQNREETILTEKEFTAILEDLRKLTA